ncbi:hypothetical protein L2E82_45353 [Cichorium intybus]|uniref:Uncharacterized protein n=1 Tax=Cichorium intybus TaxID=13427 RepID=A0ACB8ZSR5_CICIN|nr:hypothetical protein L2E82_45353 [Cichorium intybus]
MLYHVPPISATQQQRTHLNEKGTGCIPSPSRVSFFPTKTEHAPVNSPRCSCDCIPPPVGSIDRPIPTAGRRTIAPPTTADRC